MIQDSRSFVDPFSGETVPLKNGETFCKGKNCGKRTRHKESGYCAKCREVYCKACRVKCCPSEESGYCASCRQVPEARQAG